MRLRVPAEVGQVRSARQWVRAHAAEQGAGGHTLRVLELLTSELVTNAVKYGRGSEVVVDLLTGDGELGVRVHDANPEPPRLVDPAPHSFGGRGMRLVEQLAQRWGVERSGRGKAVWFCVGTRAGALRSA